MRLSRAVALGLTASVLLAGETSGLALAEPGDPSVNGELGLGSMLSGFQRDTLGYGLDLQGSLRPGLSLGEMLTFQAVLGGWWFPSSEGYGRATLLGAGFRFEPPMSTGARL